MQAHWRESQVKKVLQPGWWQYLSTLCFLAGLHGMVIELELLCNGASSDRGFPPLLCLGPQFLFHCFLHTHTNMCPPKVLIHLASKSKTFYKFIIASNIILHTLCLSISHIKTCFWLCMSVISIGVGGAEVGGSGVPASLDTHTVKPCVKIRWLKKKKKKKDTLDHQNILNSNSILFLVLFLYFLALLTTAHYWYPL